jgi:hypothetical protein
LVAKIAHGFTVKHLGLSAIAESYVVPAILGERKDIWRWVGSDGKQSVGYLEKPAHGSYHWAKSWIIGGDIVIRLKLFANADTPEYMVVVGRASEGIRGLLMSAGMKTA